MSARLETLISIKTRECQILCARMMLCHEDILSSWMTGDRNITMLAFRQWQLLVMGIFDAFRKTYNIPVVLLSREDNL